MKKTLFLLGFLLAYGSVIAQPNSEIGTGEKDGYKLVWADYFNTGKLNQDAWTIEVNGDGGGNNELQYYCEKGVSVGTDPKSGSGCLILTATKENYNGKTCTSGRITGQGKVYFTHGKIEASIKIPKTANGLWPAFWMMGNDIHEVGWPRCGEIDIMEMGNSTGIRNGTQERYFNGACHWGFYKDVGGGNWAYPMYANAVTNSYSMQDDEFHLFTCYWDNEKIAMYLDQDKYPDVQPYYEMGVTDRGGDWSTGDYFHKPFYILFNLAVGGNFTGIWDINKITPLASGPKSLYVDFVKVYQKGTADETFVGTPIESALSELETAKYALYPNPTCGLVMLSAEAAQVSVIDCTNRVLCHLQHVSQIDLSAYPDGLYIIQIVENHGKVENHKVIKH